MAHARQSVNSAAHTLLLALPARGAGTNGQRTIDPCHCMEVGASWRQEVSRLIACARCCPGLSCLRPVTCVAYSPTHNNLYGGEEDKRWGFTIQALCDLIY